MTQSFYNKLVRDLIPEIINQSGRTCKAVTLNDAEYKRALLEKLLEECQEAINADDDGLIMELADLVEVIEAILKFENVSIDYFYKLKERKKLERGGFEKRLSLVWSD